MKQQCGHDNDLCRRYGCPDSEDWKGDRSNGLRPVQWLDPPKGGDWKWAWPFPRLRFWLRTRVWCQHPSWAPGNGGRLDGWRMIDTGMRQIRWCAVCGHAQIR